MGALPKRKRTKARRGKRQSHLSLTLPTLVHCPQCHNLKPPYLVCPICGSYAGREVIKIKSPKRPK